VKKFTLFWLDGYSEIVEGRDITDAVNKAGYSQGALKALDFWAENTPNDYMFNPEKHEWQKIYKEI
jgi:hypothetical protein